MKNLEIAIAIAAIFLMLDLVISQGPPKGGPPGGGPPGGGKAKPPKDDNDESEGQNHLGPCFIYARCGEDQEAKDKIIDCFSTMEESIAIQVMDGIKDVGVYTFKDRSRDGALSELCENELELQLAIFEEGVRNVIDLYSRACSDPTQKDICKFWNEINDCVTPHLDRLHDEEKCGCEE